MTAHTCLICRAPLPPLARGSLCGRVECRWRYDATPAHRRCGACARPLEFARLAVGACDDRCQHVLIAARRDRRDRERAERARAFRDAMAADAGVADADAYLITFAPARPPDLAPFAAERHAAIERHVTEMAVAALARRDAGTGPEPRSAPEPHAEMATVFGGACGRCAGFCCANGGDHAYLDVDALQRYLDEHVELDAAGAAAAYTARLRPSSMRDSCGFHQADGCALPRDMRSNTCNDFYCHGLRRLREAAPLAGRVRAFVVTSGNDGTEFVAGAFVDSRDGSGTSPALPARPLNGD